MDFEKDGISKNAIPTLDAIEREAELLWPGFEVSSLIQGLVLLEYFEEALDLFHQGLGEPSAVDYLWAGIAAWRVRTEDYSDELLIKAEAKGEVAATLCLAQNHFFSRGEDRFLREIAALDEPFGKAHPYFRTRLHILRAWASPPNKTVEHSVEALRILATEPQAAPASGSYYTVVAAKYFATARLDHALRQLSEATSKVPPKDRLRLRYLAGVCQLRLGRSVKALESVAELDENFVYYELVEVLRAKAYLCENRLDLAELHTKEALMNARRRNRHEGIASAATLMARLRILAGHSASARRLLDCVPTEESQQSFYKMLARIALDDFEEVAVELDRFRKQFASEGEVYLEAVALLHLSAFLHKVQDSAWEEVMEELEALIEVTGSHKIMLYELCHLRDFKYLLHKRGSRIVTGEPMLELFTLDRQELLYCGKPVHLPNKHIELLCYFLERKRATLSDILVDVLSDKTRRSGASYIQNFKAKLATVLPIAHIVYDTDALQYSLSLSCFVSWDVEEVRQNRELLGGRLFLRSQTSNYVELVQHELDATEEFEVIRERA